MRSEAKKFMWFVYWYSGFHWKRPWCWEGLGAGGEGDNRGWDGWMASLTRWTWVWVNSGSWWWTGRPGVLRFMGLQRVGHDWATDLIWSDSGFTAEVWNPTCRIAEVCLNSRMCCYCCCSVAQLCPTLCDPLDGGTTGFPVLHYLLEVCSDSCSLSRWCCLTISSSAAPLLLLTSIFPSIRVFSNESVLHIRWPKYCSFSFSISPSNEYSGLISFRIDWFDLLATHGLLKSLLQHHSSKSSVLWCSAFFMVQLSHPCMTTGETIPLSIWTFVGKVMSLLFNMMTVDEIIPVSIFRGKAEIKMKVGDKRWRLITWKIIDSKCIPWSKECDELSCLKLRWI